MKKFILYTLASLGGLFLILTLIVTLSVRSLFSGKPLKIEPNSQLYIHLTQSIHDFPRQYPLTMGMFLKPSIWDVDRGLRYAAEDANIQSALIHIDFVGLTLSQAYTVGQAIKYFRSHGKRVECYASSFGSLGGGLSSYLLASYCNTITLQRLGEVAITSVSERDVLGGEIIFLKLALDKLQITPDFLIKGRYKKAPEPFLNSTFSQDNKEMLLSLIKDMESQILALLLENRSLQLKGKNQILENGPYLDVQAIKAGLIDKISNTMHRLSASVSIEEYMDIVSAGQLHKKQVIAVVQLEGSIADDGTSSAAELITPTNVKNIINAAKKRDDVKALVLSINSPGGSSLASEKIWSIIRNAQSKYKIIVCMRRAAASGGYYISAPSDYIIANPFTLTGSIGVFVGKFAIGDMLRKIGINPEFLDASSNASIKSAFSTFTNKQKAYLQQSLEHTYDRFIEVVSEGRKKSKEDILLAAEGHVWTGAQAAKNGLVDQTGTLNDAINYAMKLSNVDVKETRVELLKPEKDFSSMLQNLLSQFDATILMLNKSLQYISNMMYGVGSTKFDSKL